MYNDGDMLRFFQFTKYIEILNCRRDWVKDRSHAVVSDQFKRGGCLVSRNRIYTFGSLSYSVKI